MSTLPSDRRRRFIRRALGVIVVLGLALLLAAIVLLDGLGVGTPQMPPPRPLGKVVRLKQNWPEGWKPGERQWFEHAAQGTTIMPYEWLISLERPELRVLSRPKLFVTPDFMSRFGFLPGEADAGLNPGGTLPVGFAITRDFTDPTGNRAYNSRPYNAVGLTCAACHTGRLTAGGAAGEQVDVLIQGGSSLINVREFQAALGRAVAYTVYVPFRFDRFAERVLGRENTRSNRDRLRGELKSWFEEARATQTEYEKRHVFTAVDSGFGRTDALSLIGNRVFGALDPGNVAVANAPVNFPPIWDISWFDWVQYNGSIRMVMVRNIGEALGVGARTNTDPTSPRFMQSSVDVANMHRMEDQLGGPAPFQGLQSPRWDDAVASAGFPPVDPKLVDRGSDLFGKHCAGCHGPSTPQALTKELSAPESRYWTKPGGPPPFDHRFLKTPFIPLGRIGTDPAEATEFAFRFATLPDPSAGARAAGVATVTRQPAESQATQVPLTTNPSARIAVTAATGLRVATEQIRERAYAAAHLKPEERVVWDRFRNHSRNLPETEIISARLAYKARPLNGIWATPPFLHNGSVPTLDALLRPVAERPRSFPLSRTTFDTKLVGYATDGAQEGFQLDTSLPGNYNTGHEFRDLTLVELEAWRNLIGPKADGQSGEVSSSLSPDERWARLFGVTPERYAAMDEAGRGTERRRLTIEALNLPKSWFGDEEWPRIWFFGVIGPRLDDDERAALVEYVKTL